MRDLLAAFGVLAGGYGAWLLLSRQDSDQLTNAAIWLIVGVVLHDGVIALLTLALAAAVVPRVPVPARAPVAVGFVVLGTATLFAVPVLGRFGARPDNATLLDRNYTAGWLVLSGLVLAAVVVASLIRSRRADLVTHTEAGGTDGAGPRGRRRSHGA